ncbi:hypothetical protein F5Y18DRAFT_434062 [Xylariaceae sp. FL1019]|nr:hypothetical protein F5Y18DRAFT_434062 [Xylariaceae sp. FL1019]
MIMDDLYGMGPVHDVEFVLNWTLRLLWGLPSYILRNWCFGIPQLCAALALLLILGLAVTANFHLVSAVATGSSLVKWRIPSGSTNFHHLIPFLKGNIPKTIIARNQGEPIRGGGPLYVKQDVTWVDMPMTNGSTKQVFTDLSLE